jgi:hypothetical protein
MEFKEEKIIRELIELNTTEYIESELRPTCEFSTSEKNMPEKINILFEADKRLEAVDSRWVAFRCDTCKEYDKNSPVHFIIMKRIG